LWVPLSSHGKHSESEGGADLNRHDVRPHAAPDYLAAESAQPKREKAEEKVCETRNGFKAFETCGKPVETVLNR
jgi:hypothetical protein